MGWISFSRDGHLAAATIFVMVMTIFSISSLFLFKDVSQFLISNIKEKVDISVFFISETSEEDILKAKEAIAKLSQVKEVEYVSKEGALEYFIERHEDDPALMESLEEVGVNPFLASLKIKSFEANQYQAVAGFLESSNFGSLIEKVDYYERKPVIERIFALTSNFTKTGIVLSLILALLVILVAFNTIRVAIYNAREEIKVQRLVGASNWFIRGPFLVQGAISGLFAVLISIFTLAIFCWVLGSSAEVLFPGLNLFSFFIGNFWAIFLVQLFVGLGLGTVSSYIAVRRYLEV